MLKYVLSALFLSGGIAALSAQTTEIEIWRLLSWKDELQINDDQIQSLQKANAGYSEAYSAVYNDQTIHPDDLDATVAKCRNEHQERFRKLLTDRQVMEYFELADETDQRIAAPKRPWRDPSPQEMEAMQQEMLKTEWAQKVNLSDTQVRQIVSARVLSAKNRWEGKSFTPEPEIMSSVLNKSQLKKYQEARHLPMVQPVSQAETLSYLERLTDVALPVVEEIYIPERASLLTALNAGLSVADRELVAQWREDFSKRREDLFAKYSSYYLSFIRNKGHFNGRQQQHLLKRLFEIQQVLDDGEEPAIDFILEDRARFDQVVNLTRRYDALLDEVGYQLTFAKEQAFQQVIPALSANFPDKYPADALDEYIGKLKQKQAPSTEAIEVYRGAALLLLDAGAPETAVANRALYRAAAYPLPALERQTLNFQAPENSEVTIQLLDDQGRLLRTLVDQQPYSGGEHQLDVDVSALPAIYFYRIQSAQGISVLKSLRANK